MTSDPIRRLTDEQLRQRAADEGMAGAAGFEMARRQAERAAARISEAMSPPDDFHGGRDVPPIPPPAPPAPPIPPLAPPVPPPEPPTLGPSDAGVTRRPEVPDVGIVPLIVSAPTPEAPTEAALPAEVVETVEVTNPTEDEDDVPSMREPTRDANGQAVREGTTPGETTPTAPQEAAASPQTQRAPTVAVGGEGEGVRPATEIEAEAERLRTQQSVANAQLRGATLKAEDENRAFERTVADVQAEQQRRIADYERDLSDRQERLQQEAAAIERAKQLNPLDDPRVVEAINAQIGLYNDAAKAFQEEFNQRASDLNAYLESSTATLSTERDAAIARIAEINAPVEQAFAEIQQRAQEFNQRAAEAAAEQPTSAERTSSFANSALVERQLAHVQVNEAETLAKAAQTIESDKIRRQQEAIDKLASQVDKFHKIALTEDGIKLIGANPNELNPDLKAQQSALLKQYEIYTQDAAALSAANLNQASDIQKARIEQLINAPDTDQETADRLIAANKEARFNAEQGKNLFDKIAVAFGKQERSRLQGEQAGSEATLKVVGKTIDVAEDAVKSVEVPIAAPSTFGMAGLGSAKMITVRPFDYSDAKEAIANWIESHPNSTGAATVFRIITPDNALGVYLFVTAAGDLAQLTYGGSKLLIKGYGETALKAEDAAVAAAKAIREAAGGAPALAKQIVTAPVGALTSIPGGAAVAVRSVPSVARVGAEQTIRLSQRVVDDIEAILARATGRSAERVEGAAPRITPQEIERGRFADIDPTDIPRVPETGQPGGFDPLGRLREAISRPSVETPETVAAREQAVSEAAARAAESLAQRRISGQLTAGQRALQELRAARAATGQETAAQATRINDLQQLFARQEAALRSATSQREVEIIIGIAVPSTLAEQALADQVLGVETVSMTSAREALLASTLAAAELERGRVEVFPATDTDRLPLEERGRVTTVTPAVSPFRLADVTITSPMPTEVPTIRGIEIAAPVPATAPIVRDLPFVTPGEQPSVGAQPVVIEQPGPAPAPITAPTPEPAPEPQPQPEPQPAPAPAEPAPTPPPPATPPPDVPPPGEPPPPSEPPPSEPTRTRVRPIPGFGFEVEFDAPAGTNAPVQVVFRTGAIERRIDLLTRQSQFGADLSPSVPNDPRISPQDSLHVERFGRIDRRYVTFDAGAFMGQLDTRRRTLTFVPKDSPQGRAFERRAAREQRAIERGFERRRADGFGQRQDGGFEQRATAGFGRRRRTGFRRDV